MITTIIHTRNEQENIAECISSAQLLSQNILVVDMESTDDTIQICKKQSIKVVTYPFSMYVEQAREFGITQTKTDWVFILDADERMTKELAQEINQKIKYYQLQRNETGKLDYQTVTHFKVPRKNIFGKHKWLKHGGWWPDKQIRLLYKPTFKKWPKDIHSTPEITGKLGELNNPIIHYFHGDLAKMVEKTLIFEDIESDLLFKAKKKASTMTFFRKFVGELYRRLVKHQGYLDGTIGIIESIYQAYSKTITYLFLYEKLHKHKSKENRTL